MPIYYASMYASYRSLITTHTDGVYDIDAIDDVVTTLGPSVSENPLSLGVYKALQNSNGITVKYMATNGTTLTAYSAVLNAIYDREDVYGLVPLTHTKEIQDLVVAHCVEASSSDRNRWRICWLGTQVSETTVVLTEDSSGDPVMATIADDPDTVGTQYTYLASDGADFITAAVQALDKLRINYDIDSVTGETTYDEYVVDAVLTEENLRLVTGPTAAVAIDSKFEIWRDNSKNEMATAIATFAGSFFNRRVRVVFPDTINNGGTTYDSVYLCAALAGLRSGVAPHQGLTNVEIAGFDSVPRSIQFFGGRQLDIMAASGVWVVTQDNTGMVYTRHQLTTDTTDVNRKEDSAVSNFDNISYYMLRFFRDNRYIGRRNINEGLLVQLTADFRGAIQELRDGTATPTLGAQLNGAEIVSIEQNETATDTIDANIDVVLPPPFNNLNIRMRAI